ncbi:hypothetical protein SAMN04515665_10578 [Blastococcus sp. DSM 46786]|nr:hypothetical protein SAMN04515665_10578 [Blastococcus sp. DSM 46786]
MPYRETTTPGTIAGGGSIYVVSIDEGTTRCRRRRAALVERDRAER